MQKKILVILFFSTCLICGTIYANYEFLKGHIFAETNKESSTTESLENSSNQSDSQTESIDSSEETSQEQSQVTESEENPVQLPQVEKITKGVLDDGWEAGTANDFIEQQGNKISWNSNSSWWYTHNDSSWISNNTIGATLIINGRILAYTSEETTEGFLWKSNEIDTLYFSNSSMNMLKKTFKFKGYNMEIIQQLLEDGTAEISYQVTNKNSYETKIGVSQYINLKDAFPIRALDDFKGMNMTYNSDKILIIIPDSATMPNWSVGRNSYLKDFEGYKPKTVTGVGWESGKQPSSSDDLIAYQPVSIAIPGIVMKNPGVQLGPGESTVFKQIVRFGESLPPRVTVDQKKNTMYMTDSFDITGTISDTNNAKYRLYLEMDDSKKTLIPLKEFKDIPLQEIQNYQAIVEGKNFTEGNHTVSIVGIDEFGARSEEQKIEFTIKKFGATPLVQKVKKGENIQKELTTLFENVIGNAIQLKAVSDVDSTTVGFQWVDAILIDAELKEVTFKIPVTVYDSVTTVFNDADSLALDAKNKGFLIEEVTTAIQENRLNDLIFQQSEAKAWQMENGEDVPIVFTKQEVKPQIGNYEVVLSATKKDTNKVLEKKFTVSVLGEPLKDGWELGSDKDFISNGGYKIEWNMGGAWWYTYNGDKWMYDRSIEANLIINGIFPTGTSDVVKNGFLWKNMAESVYSIHKERNSIRRTFNYLDTYRIDIIQRLLGNNAVEITYQITNLGTDNQKIGISQYVDTYVGSDSVSVIPINNFEGINLTYGSSSLAIIPDQETMPNWAAGNFNLTQNFKQYNVQDANGLGWETGNRYRGSSGNFISPPEALKENQPVSLGDSAVSMKNPGVNVGSKESASFKQILKYGVLEAPKLTLNQTKASLYQDEKIMIDGTISDGDNKNYRVYLEMDDKDKTLVQLADYIDIPYNEVQSYQGGIEGKLFSPGVHTVSVVGIDEYGTRSVAQKIELTITELNGEPKIQKVKLGEAISNNLNTLFKEVKGNNVTLKNPLSIDSSDIGFQWIEAILIDSKQKEITERIPVNVYNEKSTVFNDTDNIALDAKDTSFELVDVRQSAEKGALDELVRQKVDSKAWNMEDGTDIHVELIKNGIKPVFGEYSGTFKGTRADSGKSVQKNNKLSVGGELKFKELPKNLDYKTSKLSQKTPYVERMKSNWKIELENTIGANWSLFASAVPFEDQEKEKLKSLLVLKADQTQDVVINGISQKIATGTETYPVVQWGEAAGLLLKVNPDAKIGRYQGEVTWLLSDAP